MESVVGMNSFWRDRSVFVTGATGLLGSWLVSQLLDADSRVVCLVRDRVPKSERVQNRRIEQVVTVREFALRNPVAHQANNVRASINELRDEP